VKDERIIRILPLAILFLLATTLFNTLRANRVEDNTTMFRKEAIYQLKLTKDALTEQKMINAEIQHKLDLLLEAQAAEGASD
jgi:hypothetical protein